MATDSPPAGFLEAARRHDPTAIRALADWYRVRGRPGDVVNNMSDAEAARYLDVLAFDHEAEHVRARQVRVVLPQLGVPTPVDRPSSRNLNRWFDERGCPVGVGTFARHRPQPLVVPTDGEHEEETRALLVALMRALCPRHSAKVEFRNRVSHAGCYGMRILGALTTDPSTIHPAPPAVAAVGLTFPLSVDVQFGEASR